MVAFLLYKAHGLVMQSLLRRYHNDDCYCLRRKREKGQQLLLQDLPAPNCSSSSYNPGTYHKGHGVLQRFAQCLLNFNFVIYIFLGKVV